MPKLVSLKPPQPIPYVEVDTSMPLETRNKLVEILRRDVELFRESGGYLRFQFEWNGKNVEVENLWLVIRMNDSELLLIQPEDPPTGVLLTDNVRERAQMENLIGGY